MRDRNGNEEMGDREGWLKKRMGELSKGKDGTEQWGGGIGEQKHKKRDIRKSKGGKRKKGKTR